MSTQSKILTINALRASRQLWRVSKKSVGFTSGVFDILHRGHVEYLEKAKSLCDILIVGINSDQSVRANKGELRPIIGESDRARVVAGISAVDHVFIFSEQNNNSNVTLLEPDVYIKAGDYSTDKLSSAALVEARGGRVEIVPFVEGNSSSSIIEKISSVALAGPYTAAPTTIVKPGGKAAFIDRDGTINEEIEYLCDPEKFKFTSGAIEGMKALVSAGYQIIVVTNQPGIGLGYYSRADLFRVNARLLKAAGDAGIPIRKIYYCPHTKIDCCSCRKPAPGMLIRAEQELGIDLKRSIMIGDSEADIGAGKAVGCKTMLVLSGKTTKPKELAIQPDITISSLGDAAANI